MCKVFDVVIPRWCAEVLWNAQHNIDVNKVVLRHCPVSIKVGIRRNIYKADWKSNRNSSNKDRQEEPKILNNDDQCQWNVTNQRWTSCNETYCNSESKHVDILVKDLWFDIEIVVKHHPHQVAFDAIRACSHDVVVHILRGNWVYQSRNCCLFVDQLPYKLELIVIANHPDNVVHKVNRVHNHEVSVQTKPLQHKSW